MWTLWIGWQGPIPLKQHAPRQSPVWIPYFFLPFISLIRLDVLLDPSVAILEEMAEKKAADLPVPVTQSSKFFNAHTFLEGDDPMIQLRQLQITLQIEKLWERRRLSRKIWVPSSPDVSSSQPFLFMIYKSFNFFLNQSKAAPSKAFLEEQAEREPSERERAEKERAKRELAKRQKLQSYEDFEPISISELDCTFFFLLILWSYWLVFSAISNTFKMSNWRTSWERSFRRHVIKDTTKYDNVVTKFT